MFALSSFFSKLVLSVILIAASPLAWPQDFTRKSVYVDKILIQVELAQSPGQWQQGLMGRTHLPDQHGMLFVFPQMSRREMWMKNTVIPLDVAFFDEKGMLVEQRAHLLPCQKDPCPIYQSAFKAKYLLELPAGSLKKYQWKSWKTQLKISDFK